MLCKLIGICLFCDVETIGFCIFICMFVSDDTPQTQVHTLLNLPAVVRRQFGVCWIVLWVGSRSLILARYPLGGLFWLPPSILRVIKARPRWKSPPGFAYLCRAAHTKTQGQWKFPEQTPSVSPPRPQLVFSRYSKHWECVFSLKSNPPPPPRSLITQV